MNLPFAIPAWMPWWVPLAVLVPVLLYVAVFLVMPFSVFGLKSRLDGIEARLEEIQGELLRIRARPPDTIPYAGPYAGSEAPPAFGRAASPPAKKVVDVEDRMPPDLDAPPPRPDMSPAARRRPAEDGPRRVEPRLDWPRP